MNNRTPTKGEKPKEKSPQTNKFNKIEKRRQSLILDQSEPSPFEEEDKKCLDHDEPCCALSHSFVGDEFSATIRNVPRYTSLCVNSQFPSPAADRGEANCEESQQNQDILTDLQDQEFCQSLKTKKDNLRDLYEEVKGRTPRKADQSGEHLEEIIEALMNKKFEEKMQSMMSNIVRSVVVGQNQCYERQNQLFKRQNQLLERQNQLLEKQNQLLERRQSRPEESAFVEQIPCQKEIVMNPGNPEEVVINPESSSDTDSHESGSDESPKETQINVTETSFICLTDSLQADQNQLPNVSFEGYSISKVSKKVHLKICLRNDGYSTWKGKLYLKYVEGVPLYNQKSSKRVDLIQPQETTKVRLRLRKPQQEESGFHIHSTIWRLFYIDERGRSHWIGKLIRVELDLRNK